MIPAERASARAKIRNILRKAGLTKYIRVGNTETLLAPDEIAVASATKYGGGLLPFTRIYLALAGTGFMIENINDSIAVFKEERMS